MLIYITDETITRTLLNRRSKYSKALKIFMSVQIEEYRFQVPLEKFLYIVDCG